MIGVHPGYTGHASRYAVNERALDFKSIFFFFVLSFSPL